MFTQKSGERLKKSKCNSLLPMVYICPLKKTEQFQAGTMLWLLFNSAA